MTRRKKIITQLGRRKLRQAESARSSTPVDRKTSRPMRRPQSAPPIDCPTCGLPLEERHRLLGADGSLFRRLHCQCGYVRVFKECFP